MQEFEAAVREQEANKRVDSKGHALCGCGAEAELIANYPYYEIIVGKPLPDDAEKRFYVECIKCLCAVGKRWSMDIDDYTGFFDTEAEAWAAWDKAMGVKGNG